MNSTLVLILHQRKPSPDKEGERYFRLDVDLPGLPVVKQGFHLMGMHDFDVEVSDVEWEVFCDGKVKPCIRLTFTDLYDDTDEEEIEYLLSSGWREVADPYSTPRNGNRSPAILCEVEGISQAEDVE